MTTPISRYLSMEVHGRVVVLRLENPPLNLMDVGFFHELQVALHRISRDSASRALVVSGYSGGPFSAGSNIKEFDQLGEGATARKILPENLALADLSDMPIPTIAAIERYALGGGLELALACDLRVVANDARLGLPEARIGGLASNGAQRLTALIGPARASEMLFLGGEIDGVSAQDIGLANWSVKPGTACHFAIEVGTRIAEGGRHAIARAKELVRESTLTGQDSFLRSVRLQQATFRDTELKKGIDAFIDKRPPNFDDPTTGE